MEVTVARLSGDELKLEVNAEDTVAEITEEVATMLDLDLKRYQLDFVDGLTRPLPEDEPLHLHPHLQLLVRKPSRAGILWEFDVPGTTANMVLDTEGRMVCPPDARGPVFFLKTASNTLGTMGSEIPSPNPYSLYCSSGVLLPDGRVYFAPCAARHILRVIPETGTVRLLGPIPGSGFLYKANGILLPNKHICFAPSGAEYCLDIDAVADTFRLFGPQFRGSDQYLAGGVLARNGLGIFAPWEATRVLRISQEFLPRAEVMEPEIPQQGSYWSDGVLAPNGLVYFMPYLECRILPIDPEAGTTGSIFVWIPA